MICWPQFFGPKSLLYISTCAHRIPESIDKHFLLSPHPTVVCLLKRKTPNGIFLRCPTELRTLVLHTYYNIRERLLTGVKNWKSDLPCLGMARSAPWWPKYEKLMVTERWEDLNISKPHAVIRGHSVSSARVKLLLPFTRKFFLSRKLCLCQHRDTLYPKAQSSRDYWPYSSVRNYNSKERNILHNSLFLISKKGKKIRNVAPLFF